MNPLNPLLRRPCTYYVFSNMFSVSILQHSLEIADTPPKPMAPIISQAEFDDMPIPAAASRSAASSRNFGSGLQHPPEPDEELPTEPAPRKSLAASREKNAGPQNKNNGTDIGQGLYDYQN